MKLLKSLTVAALAIPLALTGCVTDPVSGQRNASKTAMYGLGGAAVCGIVGALTHGGKGARNSALACGAIGAGGASLLSLLNPWIVEKLKFEEGMQLLLPEAWQMVALVALLAILGIIASYLPSRKATKLDPIEALRTE